jgi:hypothetical protein
MSKNNLNSAKYRRADNGQYTTERYAKSHPKTTVKESAPTPKKK